MLALLKKELNGFFSSPIAYLVIGVYLIVNGLFVWVLKSDFNILHAGFADLNSYFFLAPWLFAFLIPAITMRSFSEEYHLGTIEILKTKPIGNSQLIAGKFLSALLLVVFAILPTLSYVYTLYQLGNPIGNIELGTTLGAFIGLLFLASAYTAIGIFASTLSKNQIVSFLIAVSTILFFYNGFELLASTFSSNNTNYTLKNMGMFSHFNSLGRGVIDTRDVTYFTSFTLFFLALTYFKIQNEK